MPPWLIITLIVAGIGTFIGGIIWISMALDRKRAEGLKVAAMSEGFEVIGDDRGKEIQQLISGFRIGNTGRGRRAFNIFFRQTDDVRLTFFDYHFVTGTGKTQQHHQQTVALFESASYRSPEFVLKPESWMSKVGEYFGGKDIDFVEHESFSKKFELAGTNEVAIREFFTLSRLDTLSRFDKLCIESCNGAVVIWYPFHRAKPAELRTFLNQIRDIYATLV